MREKTKVIVLIQLYLAVLVAVEEDGRMRCIERKRLDWVDHSSKLLREGLFTQCYRMSARAVESLTLLLAPALQCDEAQSRRRTGIEPITPINKVTMCLRWMGGGSCHEIREIGGVSMSAFYASVYQVIDALLQHPDLRLHFPSSEHEINQVARGFQRLSSHGALNGCVGAIDGWLCPIRVPRKAEVKRVRSFFSGHYHRYGVNVQACCDHLSRFTAISCTSGGSTGDAIAYIRWKLSSIVARLRDGFYVAGDNAYVNGLHLLTPFPRPKINSIYRDSYNYHLSQLRIRIEMAFGLLVQKWRIFRAPLEVALPNVPRVIMAGAVLHNWCINQRLLENDDFSADEDEDLVEGVEEVIHQRRQHMTTDGVHGVARDQSDPSEPGEESTYRGMYMATDWESETHDDSELLREEVVMHIQRNNWLRPRHNIARGLREQIENA